METSDDDKDIDPADPMVLAGLINPMNSTHRKFMIWYPNDRFKIAWDLTMTFILLLSCYLTPIGIAFVSLEESVGWNQFILVIDLFFLMDIFVSFFSAYEDEDFKI